MRKLLVLLLLLATPVYAQLPQGAAPASGGNSADDTDCAILVRNIATGGATVAVTTLDLVFTTNGATADSDVAAASGDCGATPGTLDTGNAACDTVGELCDQINESATTRCVLLDATRADSSIRFNTLSATASTGLAGVCIPWDTSVAFQNTHLVAPAAARSIDFYLTGTAGTTLKPNPFAGLQTNIQKCTETSTYTGTDFYQVIGSTLSNGTGAARAGAEATQTYWNEVGGATTVAKIFDWMPGGIWSASGERLLTRINNNTAASVVNQFCSATTFRRAP